MVEVKGEKEERTLERPSSFMDIGNFSKLKFRREIIRSYNRGTCGQIDRLKSTSIALKMKPTHSYPKE